MRWDFDLIRRWMRRHVWIQSESAIGVQRFIERPIQADFANRCRAYRGEPVWSLKLKPRQMGSSTQDMAFLSGLGILYPGASMLAVLPSEDELLEVQEKWTVMQEATARSMGSAYPGRDRSNANFFRWRNGSRLRWYTVGGTDEVADKAGRGGTFAVCWIPEMAYPQDADLMSRAINALTPALVKARAPVIVDSTANDIEGPGRAYHQTYLAIKRGEIPGDVHFWSWWLDPLNRLDLPCAPADFAASLTSEERGLIERHGLTLHQIAWRRRQLVKPGKSRQEARRLFAQAYPSTERSAFLPKLRSELFDASLLAPLLEMDAAGDWPEPLSGAALEGLLIEDAPDDPMAVSRHLEPVRDVAVRIYHAPESERSYFVGVDPADGLPQGDWQCVRVLDDLGRTCAVVRARINPTRMAAIVQRLGTWYGWAPIRIEAAHGEVIFDRIANALALETEAELQTFEGELKVLRRRYQGEIKRFHTTRHTRPRLINGAFAALRAGGHCLDGETLADMQDLERKKDGKIAHRNGKHDDSILALGLAATLREDMMQVAADGAPPRELLAGRRAGRRRGAASYWR